MRFRKYVTSSPDGSPFTPDLLLNMAIKADEEYQTLSIEFPVGTVHDGRNDARRLREDATFCAEWMEKSGIESAMNIGPFMNTILERGQKVKIKKGARIYSTHPNIPREGIVSKKIQTITVFDAYRGFIDHHDGNPKVKQGEVHWAGTGGYWRWTDISNVIAD